MTSLLVTAGALIVAVLVAFFKGSLFGAQKERAKQATKDSAAVRDRLEMDREATAAEQKATGRTDDEAIAEAIKWSRKR
ncbi:hypothetical protein GA830_12290 [Mesorhizobium sp. NBSH29]|uniref:hypothetical protein n=1 Tax=Mesorhizobium sp. NBSH29 TaxID=2654249 RepID=UPI00189653F8|nr:hypothetical protein [Mesorhizobium sp. NBSH29]QPC87437.1 hypothetical protein GA830_12290 [Mesorhizobium sp. NBSH29]